MHVFLLFSGETSYASSPFPDAEGIKVEMGRKGKVWCLRSSLFTFDGMLPDLSKIGDSIF